MYAVRREATVNKSFVDEDTQRLSIVSVNSPSDLFIVFVIADGGGAAVVDCLYSLSSIVRGVNSQIFGKLL